jgi:hypothetical protein
VNGVTTPGKALNEIAGPGTVHEKAAVGPIHRAGRPLPWLALGVAATAALALYAPVIAGMAAEWSEFPSLSHGFAVPLLSAYLLWTRRRLLAEAPIEGSLWGLPLIVLAVAMLVIGSLGGEPFVARASLPVALLGTVLFLMGTSVTRHAWVAIAYLVSRRGLL